MAKYNDIVVTNNGLDMIAESETAKPLIFTKIQLGDGQLTEVDDIKQFTALKHPCMNGVIHDIETGTAHGQATIVSIIDNSTLDKGFFAREVGVFAKVGTDGTEKLYAYTNGGNYVDYMPDKTTPVSENKVVITLVTANAGNIQAIIDKSKIYATRQEVEDDFNTHNVDPNAHANIIKKMQDVIAKLDTVYEKQQNLYKDIFHIGAMYISFDKTNPGTWMTGTTWELTGQGRTIVGAGTADSGNAYVAGAKGGSETNTLAVENMPPHAFKGTTDKSGSHIHTGSTSTGGKHTHNGNTSYNGDHRHFIANTDENAGAILNSNTHLERWYKYDSYEDFRLWGTGSEATIGLTSQNGNHNHTFTMNEAGNHNHTFTTATSGDHTHTFTTETLGAGKAINNMQPYIVTYIWRRIA